MTDQEVLRYVEMIVADDFCEDLDCVAGFNIEELNERERILHQKISSIYRAVHSHIKSHMCHHAHNDWRRETYNAIAALKEKGDF